MRAESGYIAGMKTVLLCSGGMDSAVLLWHLRNEGRELLAMGVHYGQRHEKEIEAARSLCSSVSVEFRVADLRGIASFLSGSALTSADVEVPSGHYTDESMKQTIVPNRNMIMISVATAWALSSGADSVAYAAHAGDHVIYPDCRPQFVEALAGAIQLSDWKPIRLEAPFVHLSKSDICRRGGELGVPFDRTWSCYRGGNEHCGTCGTCVERKEAFLLADMIDPTRYQDTFSSRKGTGE